MVTSEQLYEEVKLATGDISTDLSLGRAMFVLLYNREALKWLSEKIELTKRDSRINEAQHWLVNDQLVKYVSKSNESVNYALPDDFLSFVSSTSLAQNGKCTRKLINHLSKPLNKDLIFFDALEQPSFEWEESICVISNDSLTVYYKDYNILKTHLSYYKTIEEIDLEGYSKISNIASTTINPTYNRQIANEITERVVKKINEIYKNQLGYQLAANTVQADQIT